MIDNLECKQVREMISSGGQLIDVRTPFEYKQGAIDGAVNMPVEGIHYYVDTIDKTRPVIVYCRTGARSGMVKEFLRSLGFSDVYNIGGYNQYATC